LKEKKREKKKLKEIVKNLVLEDGTIS